MLSNHIKIHESAKRTFDLLHSLTYLGANPQLLRDKKLNLAVAAPSPGSYRVVLVTRATDTTPARSGEVEVLVPLEGSVPAELTLNELPHGTLVVRADPVPEPGGELRLAPDRSRTLLPRVGGSAEFLHVPVGRALLSVSWRDGTLADELFVAEIRPGAVTETRLDPVKGGRARFLVVGTWAEQERQQLVLRLRAGDSPYGEAEGLIPLVRDGTLPIYVTRAALRPGRYHATIQRANAGPGPTLVTEFLLAAGQVVEAQASAP